MSTLEQELIKTRIRWLEARKCGDVSMCILWERIGNGIKARIAERLGLQTKDQEIENIFDGTLTKV